MPLQSTSGAASYDAFGGGVAAVPKYIEEYFSTFLYSGTGAAQTITNGIDLATKGGLVWYKSRSNVTDHGLVDTARGMTAGSSPILASNLTDSQIAINNYVIANTTGFSFGSNATGTNANASGYTYTSWTWAKAPKFFDVVTYTGNGSARTIAHNLGSVPGCMIIKDCTNAGSAWAVYHVSNGNTKFMQLQDTGAAGTSSGYWNNTTPTSTEFTIGTNGNVNQSGATYIAYLFAHDAGGFGLTGTDNVISCGSYTGNGSADGPSINLGYEAQYVLIKRTDNPASWYCQDNMRGMSQTQTSLLVPNTSDAESAGSLYVSATATGFKINSSFSGFNSSSATYIYIAIRRGPMKVPTSGTSVFSPVARTGTGANATVSGVGFPPDLFIGQIRGTAGYWNGAVDRLRGVTKRLVTSQTNAEDTTTDAVTSFTMDGSTLGIDSNGFVNESGKTYIEWNFRRAPSFFDEVCYTGTGSATTVAHNLTVAPQLMIIKQRSAVRNWPVYTASTATNEYLFLNSGGLPTTATTVWNNTAPTSSVFSVGTSSLTNASAGTYVAYLFSSCAGVSKVGSYTGTGALQTINCGFTSGARFVLIKLISSGTSGSGDWYVWDSARGISSGNDPYLLLDSTSAEVTGTNYVDTDTTGFKVTAAGATDINASGDVYLFLAIA